MVTGSRCSARRPPVEAPALWHANGFHATVLEKLLSGYEAIFKYIAAREGLPQDRRTILGVAADSTAERSYPDPIGTAITFWAEVGCGVWAT
jgi:hypothetical protein